MLQVKGKHTHTRLVSEDHTRVVATSRSAELQTSAAVGAELEGGRSAAVAVPPHHVGSTLTLSAAGVTHGAERALRVTLAFWEMESNKGEALERPACLDRPWRECEELGTSRGLFRSSRIKRFSSVKA